MMVFTVSPITSYTPYGEEAGVGKAFAGLETGNGAFLRLVAV